jgi:chitinase
MKLIKKIKIFVLTIVFFNNMMCYSVDYKTPFSPYAQISLYDGDQLIKTLKSLNLREIILAFIQDGKKCVPSWDGSYYNSLTDQKYIKIFKLLKENSIQYHISIGGADGNDLSNRCTTSIELFQAYEKIYNLYHPFGLDFDLESHILSKPKSIKKIIQAIKIFHTKYTNVLLTLNIPTMPYSIENRTKKLIKDLAAHQITFTVNLLAMSYHKKYNQNMAKYAIQAVNNLRFFLNSVYPKKETKEIWKIIHITPMIGINDIKNEVFTIANVSELKNFADKVKVGGLHMRSLDRDKPCENKTSIHLCSGINTQKYFDFTKTFLK